MPSPARPAAVHITDTDRPDPSYWTAYDHFMVEREARAMRHAYTWSLLVRAFDALRARFAGARRGDGRRAVSLNPRT